MFYASCFTDFLEVSDLETFVGLRAGKKCDFPGQDPDIWEGKKKGKKKEERKEKDKACKCFAKLLLVLKIMGGQVR